MDMPLEILMQHNFKILKLIDTGKSLLLRLLFQVFGGGNSWNQYLAAFSKGYTNEGMIYYSLLDFVLVGNGVGAVVQDIKASVITLVNIDEIAIEIDTLDHGPEDARCCPTKKAKLKQTLKNNRFRN